MVITFAIINDHRIHNSFSVIIFGFDPVSYSVNEDAGAQALTVTIVSGDPGEFSFDVTAATDNSSSAAAATGKISLKSHLEAHYKFIVFSWA